MLIESGIVMYSLSNLVQTKCFNSGMELFVSSPTSYSHALWLPSPPPSSSHNCRLSSSSLLSLSRRSSSPLPYIRRQLAFSSSSSPSSSDNKYESYFPCYDLDYLSIQIDWRFSREIKLDSPSDDDDDNGDDDDYDDNGDNDDDFLARLDEITNKHRVKCSLGFGEYEQTPHYGYGFDNDDDTNEPFLIQEGHHFDVISLLSTHSDDLVRIAPNNNKSTDFVKAHNLRGKYILLCCAFVPSLWNDPESSLWRNLSLLASELTEKGGIFEIVIIPKMRQKWDNDEGVVHHLFSAFSGCLAVPFTHKFRRDYLCKALNFDGEPRYILVDPSLKVLQVDSRYIFMYGTRGFPFSHKHLTLLHREDSWHFQPCAPSNKSLAGLLGCKSKPSSFLLRKFDSEETISVEQLNKKHVGLYLFNTGDMFKEFDMIYKQCRSEGLDFEIVLVCLPRDTSVHPVDFQDVVLSAMRKHHVSDWWLFPYNSACLKLNNLSNSCFYHYDSMIIVGPQNKFVDWQGSKVIQLYGLHFGMEAYPFTMEALVQAFLRRMDKITLESFLNCDYVYRDYGCDESKRMCVSELKGKNIIVYVDYPAYLCPEWMPSSYDNTLLPWYNTIKEKDPNFEVVFVPVYPKSEGFFKVGKSISESKMKWLVCLLEDTKLSQLLKHDAFIFLVSGYTMPRKGLPIPVALAFGEDGHLHSIDALDLFFHHGLDAYPFLCESRNLNLRNEITYRLFDKFGLKDNTTLSL